MKLFNSVILLAVTASLALASTNPVESSTRSVADALEASKAATVILPAEAAANEIVDESLFEAAEIGKRAITHLYVCMNINF